MGEQVKIAVLMPDDNVRATFIPPSVAREIEQIGECTWNQLDSQYNLAELRDALAEATICVTGWGNLPLDEAALERAHSLRMLVHTGGSVAPYVSEALYDRGIRVISGNELYADSVAEGAVAYMLCALRRIPFYNDLVQNGGWGSVDAPYEGLLDQTVGLVGFGAIARKVVPLLRPFRVNILAYDPFVDQAVFDALGVTRCDSLKGMLERCKVISVHLPKTEATRHVLNRDMLAALPDGAMLVNTARGSVIDEQALADELSAGRLRAILDVFESEPLSLDSRLRRLDNVILLPHMGGPTFDRRPKVTEHLLQDVARFLRGEPLQYEISRQYAQMMTNDRLPV